MAPSSEKQQQEKKACIIDGKAIAQTIRSEITTEVKLLSEKYGMVPGLAVVLVGSRKDSQSYVNLKRKACVEVGIKSFNVDIPEQVSEAELIAKVHELNANPDVHGILVQLPLPSHMVEENVMNEISIEKDVDGLHPMNIGKLAMKGRDPLFQPCGPKACLELLSRSGISVKGKRAVVIGRSNIVGLPVSLLLLKADATVTIINSHTPGLESIIREADIVISAAGKAHLNATFLISDVCMAYVVLLLLLSERVDENKTYNIGMAYSKHKPSIKGDWIKPGAAVIDVGTNAVADPSHRTGYRPVGDVDFDQVCEVAGWVTPVPGGVGPMTIAMLLRNTFDGAKRKMEQ
ncbi:hypothetical protein C5167_020940 [Papaver somniferum]|uniref:methenyltetrahydrofolate cyclohydrolase n=1 Tax=Papaver somniferum TaxID=3469 RepID=A0A4Y7IUH3_PAPSO|nr:hypothetical protein C5167_020940 [Papaver somniferum]